MIASARHLRRSSALLRLAVAAVVVSVAIGCSALVSPDKDRLGARVDGGPTSSCDPVDCADGVVCTEDVCVDGSCENRTSDSLCAANERCDPIAGCVRTQCEGDADCDNGNACDGKEICGASGCEAGQPLDCDDGIGCTVDRCEGGACVNETDDTQCTYEDLCVTGVCGEHEDADARGCRPVDKICDDGDECTLEACDPSTGMCVDETVDADADGSPLSETCERGDCNDRNPSIYPGAKEYCNGRDDNCDGEADDSCIDIPTTCQDAIDVDVDQGQTRTIEFEISQFTDDYVTPCHGPTKANGPDAVFRIRVDGESDVLIDTTESDFDTVIVTSFGGCARTAFENEYCDDDAPGANPLGSRLWRQRTNDFFLLIDSVEGSSGRARIEVTAMAPAPNLCGDSLDISAGGTWIGKTRSVALYDGACDSAGTGKEGVAHFRAATSGKARLEGVAFSNGFFDHALYAYEDNCNVSVACDGHEPLLIEPTLEAGKTYVVFADGAQAGSLFAVKYSPP